MSKETSHHTIQIAKIELHPGPFTLEIESPAGKMKLRPDEYLVTDTQGGTWVFTERQLRELNQKPENN